MLSLIRPNLQNRGEYRSRTDDLLNANQALQPAELIPRNEIQNNEFRIAYYTSELPTSRISLETYSSKQNSSLGQTRTADLYIISVAL